ncbi:MAG: DNA primase [Anaerolineae bacterium]
MSVVDEIKQRLDIVEFIGSYVPLQKAGRNYKGLCPFHSEKTPSFIVFPENQGWHCFGACSTGGDIFSFVMRRENMDFPEALRFLAERAGVDLRPLDDVEIEQRNELERLRAANAAAADYYHRVLMESPQGEGARRYLERRGVTRETMAAFQLGYALPAWHALEETLTREKIARDDLLTAGLLSENESGNIYDRFRGRIMFPIRDVRGHVIGFGGRSLDDENQPKYLNSPQTPLFDKSSVLYGIDLARDAIRESETAIIVEGYMDVVVPYQHGVRNMVACMGTALTEAHLDVLKRLAGVLILALDPDAAGMRAVERGIETAQQALPRRSVPVPTATGLIRWESRLDTEIRIMVLPDGLDPDELIQTDRDRWDQLVAGALPVADYFFGLAMDEIDISTARGKRQAMDRLVPVIVAMDNLAERTHYIQRLARWIRVDERQLADEVERRRGGTAGLVHRPAHREPPRPRPTPPSPREESHARPDPAQALEARCLALLLHAPEHLAVLRETIDLSVETFTDTYHRLIYTALEAYIDRASTDALSVDDPNIESEFLAQLDTESRPRVESLLTILQSGPPLSPDMVREDLYKSAMRLRKSHISRLIRELRFVQQDAQEQGLDDQVRELNETIEHLRRDYLQVDQRYYAATLVGRKQARESLVTNHGL